MQDTVEDLRYFASFIVPLTAVACVLLIAQRFLKGAMPSMVLSGLVFMTLKTQGAPQLPAASSKKQEKKQSKAVPSSSVMTWSQVHPGLLDRLEMTEEFDMLLLGCVSFATIATCAVAIKWLLYPIVPTFYLSFSITGLFFVVGLMIKVEWAHSAVVRSEKISMLLVGLAAASLSFWLLMYAPRSLHAFDAQGASVELAGRFKNLMDTRLKKLPASLDLQAPELVELPAMGVALPLALAGGLLSALLMAPGLRYGKVLQVLLKPPLWARNFAGRPSLGRLLVQAGFLAQVALLPLWVPTLMDALRLPPGVVCYLRGGSMLLVVGLQLLALPNLAQAHLFIAAYKADIIQNMSVLDAASRTALLKRQFSRTLSELCKVALQLAFVPTLLLLCGCLHMLMAYPSPLAADHPKASIWDKQPSVLFQTLAGFLGWWACGSLVVWAVIGVVLTRAQGGLAD
ncbi:hypothetical protein OEZ86_011380 [Tetradesmus obliquus]|uniref:Uncharacterized protein n=1 Tax=Tetradesmus obliquus TaxID=3088 RepID=A0ABY8TI86_TETOB|nr:hypothetical protein OEZ85_008223 [Tetradesmus obliquus]WIA28854.1 hypothetical protein OEZ86_011380 [Tetradesmus obliquus]